MVAYGLYMIRTMGMLYPHKHVIPTYTVHLLLLLDGAGVGTDADGCRSVETSGVASVLIHADANALLYN